MIYPLRRIISYKDFANICVDGNFFGRNIIKSDSYGNKQQKNKGASKDFRDIIKITYQIVRDLLNEVRTYYQVHLPSETIPDFEVESQ